MPSLGPWEIIAVLVVLVLLFGAKRLPDTARGLGRSLRILKAETKGLRDDDDDKTVVHTEQVVPRPIETTQAPQQTPVTQAQPVQAQPAHPVQAPPAPPVPHRADTTER